MLHHQHCHVILDTHVYKNTAEKNKSAKLYYIFKLYYC